MTPQLQVPESPSLPNSISLLLCLEGRGKINKQGERKGEKNQENNQGKSLGGILI